MKNTKMKSEGAKIILSARVPVSLHAALWREAGRRGITLSQLINEMLEDAVSREESPWRLNT